MDKKELELKFRQKVNEITKSDKSLAIFMDGKVGSLKDKIMDKIIDWIEPSRYQLFKYQRKHFNIKDFWVNSPSKHVISIYDGSFYSELNELEKRHKIEQLRDITFFENMMNKYGFAICPIKFKEGKNDECKIKKDGKILKIEGNDEEKVFEQVILYLINTINVILSYKLKNIVPEHITENPIDLSAIQNDWKYTTEEEYYKQLKKLKKKIRELHEKLIKKDKAVAIVFQGIDGSGKSSTIKRLTSKMIPHWFNVYGIRKPSEEELNHHYLWRFWNKLPNPGEIALYDRSWYERLTSERVLKLNNNDWVNAVPEINEFERELEANGIKVFKFWFNIDKDTQAERFTERENNPLKNWKISKADYETREKWDEYQKAFSEMLGATMYNDRYWAFIDSTNKKEARINCMRIFVKELKHWLKKNS